MSLLQIHEPGETPAPHAEDELAVGIDLGTTHSVVSVSDGGHVEVLHDICGGALVPSAVHYGAQEMQVGKQAFAQGAGAVHSIKRLMGRGAEDADALAESFPYEVLKNPQGALAVKTAQGPKTPVEISADILRHLRKLAEKSLQKEVAKAVITVPAYFDDAARTATRDAAKLAGLEVLRLVNEPTAAALAYGLDNAAEGVYAIYDLGGGTFDISILNLEKGVFQVLSTGGDIALGGDDFDAALSEALQKASGEINLLQARKIKEQLSEAEAVEVEGHTITRAEFEALIEPFLQKTIHLCEQALQDADVTAAEVKGVVLVGGSTRIPAVRDAVQGLFKTEPLTNVDPDQVVAVGAAIQAEGLTRGSDNLLLDVTPLSLGLETMGEIVEKVIYRNTPTPVSASQEFTTYKDGQTAMLIHVLQGEREMVSQCRSLAKFTLSGIPPLPAGIARIKVTFTVDADGLLSVTAREETTGMLQHVEVKPTYGLPPEQIEKMLYESMSNAREDIGLRLLAEARMESGRLIEEIKSAMGASPEDLQTGEKEAFTTQIGALQAAVDGDDRDAIDYQRDQLEHLTQPFAERRMDSAITSALKGSHIEQVE